MLKNLLKAFRHAEPSPEEYAYRQLALAILAEAEQRDQAWLARVHSTSDYAALANLAAVYRWELSLLSRQLLSDAVPASLRKQALECQQAMTLSAEAFHRMTSGYRFFKFERVCEGHALLEEARAKRQRLAAQLDVASRSPGLGAPLAALPDRR